MPFDYDHFEGKEADGECEKHLNDNQTGRQNKWKRNAVLVSYIKIQNTK